MPNLDKVPKAPAHSDRSHARSQAAAWAWHYHAGSSRGRLNQLSEVGASRKVIGKFGRAQPSRFKMEAELWKTEGRNCIEQRGRELSFDRPGLPSKISEQNPSSEFKSSLFDSFELLAISKHLDESVRREATTKRPEKESWSGGTAASRITGSNTVKRNATPRIAGKRSPFQDSRHDRALFSQFRIGAQFCRSAETVSCQAAKRHVQVVKQSLTTGYTNLDANDVPLFKRRSCARTGKKQSRYAQSSEENQDSRHCKTEKVLHMMSLKDVSKVLQEVNHLPQFHSGNQRSHGHHLHQLHHQHHHHVQFLEEADGAV